MTPRNAFILVLSVGILWALADQWTKYLAVRDLTRLFPDESSLVERVHLFYTTHDLFPHEGRSFSLVKPPVEIIPGFWNHRYVQNPAGAFGLLSGVPDGPRRLIFTIVALLAAAAILFMATQNHGRGMLPTQLCLALVFGGAIGNLIDRVVHGYVIDFIDWYVTIGGSPRHWPAFNLADVGIVVGVFGLFFLLNFGRASGKDSGDDKGSTEKSLDTKEQAEAG